MDAAEAIGLLKGMRVFVTSRERIKQPEGHDLFDEAIKTLEEAARELPAASLGEVVAVADAEIRALYVGQHGSYEGWLGIEGSYFIAGVQAARRAAAAPTPSTAGSGDAYDDGTGRVRDYSSPPAKPEAGEVDVALELRRLRYQADCLDGYGMGGGAMNIREAADKLETALTAKAEAGEVVTQEVIDSICKSLFGGCLPVHQSAVRNALNTALTAKAEGDGGEGRVSRPDPEIDMLTEEESRRLSAGLPIWPSN